MLCSQAVFFAGIPMDSWEKSWCRHSVPRGGLGEGYIISYILPTNPLESDVFYYLFIPKMWFFCNANDLPNKSQKLNSSGW